LLCNNLAGNGGSTLARSFEQHSINQSINQSIKKSLYSASYKLMNGST